MGQQGQNYKAFNKETPRPAISDSVGPMTLQRSGAVRATHSRALPPSPMSEIFPPQPQNPRANFVSVVETAQATERALKEPHPAVAQFTEYLSMLPHPGGVRPPRPPVPGRPGSPPYPRFNSSPHTVSSSSDPSNPPSRISRFTENLTSLPLRHPLDAPLPVPPRNDIFVPPARSIEIPPGMVYTPGVGLARQLRPPVPIEMSRPSAVTSRPTMGTSRTSVSTRPNPVELVRSVTDQTPLDSAVQNRYWHPMLQQWLEFPTEIAEDEKENKKRDLLKRYGGRLANRLRGSKSDKNSKNDGEDTSGHMI